MEVSSVQKQSLKGEYNLIRRQIESTLTIFCYFLFLPFFSFFFPLLPKVLIGPFPNSRTVKSLALTFTDDSKSSCGKELGELV